MTPNSQPDVLGREDIFQIVDNLDQATGVLYRGKPPRALTPADIHLKSMLSTLRRELMNKAREPEAGNSRTPLPRD